MAALTSSGARNASEIVLLILRGLHRSLLAMLSVVALGSVVISSSQVRPRAIDATGVGEFPGRIGRVSWVWGMGFCPVAESLCAYLTDDFFLRDLEGCCRRSDGPDRPTRWSGLNVSLALALALPI